MKFILPIEALPKDDNERYQILHEYFCDQRGHSYQVDNHWVIEVYWPPTLDYFIDPNIQDGFHWWDANLDIKKVSHQVRLLEGYQLSLQDSWTLYSWSQWLSKHSLRSPILQDLVILHVDYHTDLMSPRLCYTNPGYKDLLTGEYFAIQEPETVRKAILSGAVGIGSFMVPFLHETKSVHIRHLCERPSVENGLTEKVLKKGWEKDSLLALNHLRPKVSFHGIDSKDIDDNSIRYLVTSDINEWVSDIPDGPVLLHIDMDYFNCRYDGDSDWHINLPRHDPAFVDMEEKMESLFASIANSGIKSKVKDITVSLSPGFFPAEFWQKGVERISELIHHLRE